MHQYDGNFTRRLLEFIAVAETNSWSAAARKLKVSRFAVREGVKALEENLGVGLVASDGTGAFLTSAGEIIFEDARKVIEASNILLRHADESHEVAKELRLAVSMLPLNSLGFVLDRFYTIHPKIRVRVFSGNILECHERLLNRQVDIVIDSMMHEEDLIVSGRDQQNKGGLCAYIF